MNIEWLATGEGNKFKDSAIPISEDKKYTEIKMLWDRLDEAKKKELLNYGDYIVKK